MRFYRWMERRIEQQRLEAYYAESDRRWQTYQRLERADSDDAECRGHASERGGSLHSDGARGRQRAIKKISNWWKRRKPEIKEWWGKELTDAKASFGRLIDTPSRPDRGEPPSDKHPAIYPNSGFPQTDQGEPLSDTKIISRYGDKQWWQEKPKTIEWDKERGSKEAETAVQHGTGIPPRTSRGKLPFYTDTVSRRDEGWPRTDQGKLPSDTTKRTLFGKQEGICAGCKMSFPFQNFTIDLIVPQSKDGTRHLDNLQLLCNACNFLKGGRDQAYLVAELKKRERVYKE